MDRRKDHVVLFVLLLKRGRCVGAGTPSALKPSQTGLPRGRLAHGNVSASESVPNRQQVWHTERFRLEPYVNIYIFFFAVDRIGKWLVSTPILRLFVLC